MGAPLGGSEFVDYVISLPAERNSYSVLLGSLSHLRETNLGLTCSDLVSADSNEHRIY